MSDAVNHPSHYNSHPSGIECLQVVRHFNFNLGNVIKYIWRAGKKGEEGLLKDLKKARFYLEDEIKKLETEETENTKTWNCPCGVVNISIVHDYCMSCSRSRVSSWQCKKCSRVNKAETCFGCGSTKPVALASALAEKTGWNCPCGSKHIVSSDTFCPTCKVPRKNWADRPYSTNKDLTPWKCENCCLDDANGDSCIQCGSAKGWTRPVYNK